MTTKSSEKISELLKSPKNQSLPIKNQKDSIELTNNKNIKSQAQSLESLTAKIPSISNNNKNICQSNLTKINIKNQEKLEIYIMPQNKQINTKKLYEIFFQHADNFDNYNELKDFVDMIEKYSNEKNNNNFLYKIKCTLIKNDDNNNDNNNDKSDIILNVEMIHKNSKNKNLNNFYNTSIQTTKEIKLESPCHSRNNSGNTTNNSSPNLYESPEDNAINTVANKAKSFIAATQNQQNHQFSVQRTNSNNLQHVIPSPLKLNMNGNDFTTTTINTPSMMSKNSYDSGFNSYSLSSSTPNNTPVGSSENNQIFNLPLAPLNQGIQVLPSRTGPQNVNTPGIQSNSFNLNNLQPLIIDNNGGKRTLSFVNASAINKNLLNINSPREIPYNNNNHINQVDSSSPSTGRSGNSSHRDNQNNQQQSQHPRDIILNNNKINHIPPINNQEWHRDILPELRDHLVKKILTAIYPNFNSTHEQEAIGQKLIDFSKKIESDAYETSVNKDSYYHKLADQIYKIKRELDNKDLGDSGSQSNSNSITPTNVGVVQNNTNNINNKSTKQQLLTMPLPNLPTLTNNISSQNHNQIQLIGNHSPPNEQEMLEYQNLKSDVSDDEDNANMVPVPPTPGICVKQESLRRSPEKKNSACINSPVTGGPVELFGISNKRTSSGFRKSPINIENEIKLKTEFINNQNKLTNTKTNPLSGSINNSLQNSPNLKNTSISIEEESTNDINTNNLSIISPDIKINNQISNVSTEVSAEMEESYKEFSSPGSTNSVKRRKISHSSEDGKMNQKSKNNL